MSAIYLAARFSRRHECYALAVPLMAAGHTITSRWVLRNEGTAPAGPSEEAPPAMRRMFAMEDVDDVLACDWMVSLMEEPRGGGRGGRHIEFGMALGLGKRLTIIGPRETVFHHLDLVEQFDTVAQFRRSYRV